MRRQESPLVRLLARVKLVRLLARVTPAIQLLRHTSVRLCIHDNIYVLICDYLYYSYYLLLLPSINLY